MNRAETPQGWQAHLALEYARRGTRTRLVGKRQRGPLTLQRALYPEGGVCHSYLLHPPGGVVGNDSLVVDIALQAGSHTLLTTPGANKFYRSGQSRRASLKQVLAVGTGAIMEWLPQQNIYFPGAHAVIDTDVDVASGGHFVGWELHCFGRPATGECFSDGEIRGQTRIAIDGELRLVERLQNTGMDNIRAATGLRGLPMQGSLIAAPCQPPQRDALARILQNTVQATYPHPLALTLVDDVLVVRALGVQAAPMLAAFTRLWGELRQQWLAIAPCIPRIWST